MISPKKVRLSLGRGHKTALPVHVDTHKQEKMP